MMTFPQPITAEDMMKIAAAFIELNAAYHKAIAESKGLNAQRRISYLKVMQSQINADISSLEENGVIND